MKVILLSHTLDGASICGQAAAVCTASGNPAKSLRAALTSGHESVLEHVSFTFRIGGLSRAALAQLNRHRLASFDVESQHYVKLEDVRMVMPDSIARSEFLQEAEACLTGSMNLYKRMVAGGIPPEDARYVTPQAVVTNLLMTMNVQRAQALLQASLLQSGAVGDSRCGGRDAGDLQKGRAGVVLWGRAQLCQLWLYGSLSVRPPTQ